MRRRTTAHMGVRVGDVVKVGGRLDRELFEGRELMADYVFELSS